MGVTERIVHILVTGGSGFIGSHFVRLLLRERPQVRVTNLDALTYAGDRRNLADVEHHGAYRFVCTATSATRRRCAARSARASTRS